MVGVVVAGVAVKVEPVKEAAEDGGGRGLLVVQPVGDGGVELLHGEVGMVETVANELKTLSQLSNLSKNFDS